MMFSGIWETIMINILYLCVCVMYDHVGMLLDSITFVLFIWLAVLALIPTPKPTDWRTAKIPWLEAPLHSLSVALPLRAPRPSLQPYLLRVWSHNVGSKSLKSKECLSKWLTNNQKRLPSIFFGKIKISKDLQTMILPESGSLNPKPVWEP